MLSGVLAALGAALLYNLAVVIEKSQAEQVEANGLRILGSLAKRPIWLLGFALQLVGFGLHYLALTRAPVIMVQPIIAAGIVFVVVFSALLLGERIRRREVTGIFLAISGVMLLLVQLQGSAAMGEVHFQQLVAVLVAAAIGIGVLLAVSASPRIQSIEIRAVALGTAAGLGQGMSDAMNRLMGAWLSPHSGWVPPDAMGITAMVCLAPFGFEGLAAAQNGLKAFRANTVVPCMLTTQLLVPVVLSLALFGQPAPTGVARLAVWVGAFGLTLGGILTLSMSPAVASQFAVRADA
jgi:drug/metabolite transporter (DMT)-like permease